MEIKRTAFNTGLGSKQIHNWSLTRVVWLFLDSCHHLLALHVFPGYAIWHQSKTYEGPAAWGCSGWLTGDRKQNKGRDQSVYLINMMPLLLTLLSTFERQVLLHENPAATRITKLVFIIVTSQVRESPNLNLQYFYKLFLLLSLFIMTGISLKIYLIHLSYLTFCLLSPHLSGSVRQ